MILNKFSIFLDNKCITIPMRRISFKMVTSKVLLSKRTHTKEKLFSWKSKYTHTFKEKSAFIFVQLCFLNPTIWKPTTTACINTLTFKIFYYWIIMYVILVFLDSPHLNYLFCEMQKTRIKNSIRICFPRCIFLSQMKGKQHI